MQKDDAERLQPEIDRPEGDVPQDKPLREQPLVEQVVHIIVQVALQQYVRGDTLDINNLPQNSRPMFTADWFWDNFTQECDEITMTLTDTLCNRVREEFTLDILGILQEKGTK